jgi:hypothetical protein
MLAAFEKLYNYYREKRPKRTLGKRKSEEYYEKNIYWADRKPKRGVERHQLKAKCGSKCFLLPEEEKFPVCKRCSENVCICGGDCAGLLSAYRRARQLTSRFPERSEKYEKVAKEAKDRAEKRKCGWTERSAKKQKK